MQRERGKRLTRRRDEAGRESVANYFFGTTEKCCAFWHRTTKSAQLFVPFVIATAAACTAPTTTGVVAVVQHDWNQATASASAFAKRSRSASVLVSVTQTS